MSYPESRTPLRIGAWLLGALPVAFLPSQSAAQTRVNLEVDATQTVSSNAFLIPGGDRTTVAFDLVAKPTVELALGPGTMVGVSGAVGVRQYDRRFGNFLIGHADTNFRHRENEYVSVSGLLSYARELPIDGISDSIDAAIDTLSIRSTYLARSNVTWNPNEMTTVVGDVSLQRTSHPDSTILAGTTYRNVRVGISKRVGPLTNIGFATDLTMGDSGFGGESSAKSLRFTAARRLGSDWRGDVQLGVERLTMKGVAGLRGDSRTNLSGSGNFCYEPQRMVICASGALRSELSGIGGLQRELSFAAHASRRLSEYRNLTATAEYRTSRIDILDRRVEVLRLATAYDQRLNNRLTLTGGVDYLRRTRITGEKVGAVFFKFGLTVRGLSV